MLEQKFVFIVCHKSSVVFLDKWNHQYGLPNSWRSGIANTIASFDFESLEFSGCSAVHFRSKDSVVPLLFYHPLNRWSVFYETLHCGCVRGKTVPSRENYKCVFGKQKNLWGRTFELNLNGDFWSWKPQNKRDILTVFLNLN